MDAAVYYIEENHRRKAMGKKIGYEAAGAQFDTTSKRQIIEAVRDLEATGTADELRAAMVATPAAPAKRQKLSPNSKTKAAYKLATKERDEGATLEDSRTAALKMYGTSPCLQTINRLIKGLPF
jgi:ribosomal protein S6E (S10)